MNIMHSSRTDRWFTPEGIIKRVHEVLGQIDLDPASEECIQHRVKAKKILTRDAETSEWLSSPGTVFCNPPGGKSGNKSMSGIFWKKMMEERSSGRLTHGIFLCFSIEALQHTQRLGCESIGEFPLCIPKTRIKFDYPNGKSGVAPSHSNAIVYVPGTLNNTESFVQSFKDLGIVLNVR